MESSIAQVFSFLHLEDFITLKDNHNGVLTHLEPDILECEVKWALESIIRTELVEVMEFQLSYFRS